MADDRITHIYTLRDPRNNEIRYVGKTVMPLRHRLDNHLYCARRGDKTHRDAWIRILLAADLKPIIEKIATARADWAEVETYWIAKLRSEGVRLTNLSAGGDGPHGVKRSDEYKRAVSRRAKIQMACPEMKKLIGASTSAHMKAAFATPEGRARIMARMEKARAVSVPVHSAVMKAKYEDPEFRAANIARLARVVADPEWRAAQSARVKAEMADSDRVAKLLAYRLDPERVAIAKAKNQATWTQERRSEAALMAKQRADGRDPEQVAEASLRSAKWFAGLPAEKKAEISTRARAQRLRELASRPAEEIADQAKRTAASTARHRAKFNEKRKAQRLAARQKTNDGMRGPPPE